MIPWMRKTNEFLDIQEANRSKVTLSLLKLADILMQRYYRVRFPQRATGGDWWIYRWRLNFLLGWLENESVKWCEKYVQPGAVVLDVGAHLGYYTRIFSQLVGESGVVFAFEPCPENYPILKHNLSAASFHNVKIINKAVSEQNGSASLFISSGHSMHSLNAGFEDEQGKVDVETIALDSFFAENNIDNVDFIKIDVEGAEPLVLRGMKRLVSKSPSLKMLIEYNPIALRAGNHDPLEFLAMLAEMGFVYKQINKEDELIEINLDSDDCVNLLCVRSK